MWFFKKNRIKDINEHESVSLVEAFFSDSPLRRNSFYLESVGEAYWIITNGIYTFSINDHHTSGSFKGPIKFKKSDAKKVKRFLNVFYEGEKYTFSKRVYLRICSKLNLSTGLYYK